MTHYSSDGRASDPLTILSFNQHTDSNFPGYPGIEEVLFLLTLNRNHSVLPEKQGSAKSPNPKRSRVGGPLKTANCRKPDGNDLFTFTKMYLSALDL